MYYCRTCNKYVKEGNVCDSCGKKMSPQEGIVFCPKCNKSFFFPGINKKFTCQGCGTQIVVDDKFLRSQKGKTSINTVGGGTKEENGSSFNNTQNSKVQNNNTQNQDDSIQYENDVKDNDFNEDETYRDILKLKDDEKLSNEIANDNSKKESTEESNLSTLQQREKKADAGLKKETDDIDESLFQDAGNDDVKEVDNKPNSKGKNKKEKVAKIDDGEEGSKDVVKSAKRANTLSFISISLMFVLILGAIIYLFIIPALIPTYKVNWDKFISAQNHLNESMGDKDRINTISFDVEDKTNEQVVAIVKVEEKDYDEVTKSFNNSIITYRVTFIKKNGSFVVYDLTDITE